jgi:hypothetical protein
LAGDQGLLGQCEGRTAGLSQDLPQNGPLSVVVAEPLGAAEEMLVPLTTPAKTRCTP